MKNGAHCKASLGAFVNIIDYSPQSWADQMATLRQLERLGHVEIWFEWLPSTATEIRHLVECFQGESVLIHAPFLGVSLVSPWDELRELGVRRIAQTCEVATELRSRVVTVHPGAYPAFDHLESMLDRLADSYELINSSHPSVSIGIENMARRAGLTIESFAHLNECEAILDRIPTARFTLDVGHAIQNGDNFQDFICRHRDAIVNIHLHDGVKQGRSHLRLGTGDLDLASFARTCITYGYDKFISLETLGREATSESWRQLIASLDKL